MKNYFILSIISGVLFINCVVIASEGRWEGPLFEVAIKELMNKSSMRWSERQKDCALVLMDFRNKKNKNMIGFAKKFAINLHYNSKNREPILLCPNEKYDRTTQDNHWVHVEHYNSNNRDHTCPYTLRDTHYNAANEKRLSKDSSLVLYLLHKDALTVVPDHDQKTSLQNSKIKHQQELSFMLHNREDNDKAPVIIIVDDSLNGVLENDSDEVKRQKRENLIRAFEENNVEGFLDCLYETSIEKKQSFFSYNSLKFLAIPIVLVIGMYCYFRYRVMINVCMH